MIASKLISPRPTERKSQPRPGAPKSRCDERMPLPAVERDGGVLHVDVVDAVGELLEEADRVDPLPLQVTRVEVEAERLPPADRVERAIGGNQVERDLRRVNLEREADTVLLERIEDRMPQLGKPLVAGSDRRFADWRERIEKMPDRRSGEAADDRHPEAPCGARGILHRLHRPGALPFRVAGQLGRRKRVGPVVVGNRRRAGPPDDARMAQQPRPDASSSARRSAQ